mgnify:CR=1 FL=1
MLTAYDQYTAQIFDEAGYDIVRDEVTSAKADLTANWNWTGGGPQITLGTNGTQGQIRLYEGGTHYYTLSPATLTGNLVYTIPDAGGAAVIIEATGQTIVFRSTNESVTNVIGEQVRK